MASITESQYWRRMCTNIIDTEKSADEANKEVTSYPPTIEKNASYIT